MPEGAELKPYRRSGLPAPVVPFERLLPRVRREFPATTRDADGRRRAFLDNGAGTLVTRRAQQREAEARVRWSANVGNPFPESAGAEAVIEAGRRAVADLLNAEGPATILSGESATSLLFHLAYALGRTCRGTENVVLTAYEHFANVSPWEELASRGTIREVRFADFDRESGDLDLDHLASLVDGKTKVVSVAAASNVLGTRSPLSEIAKIAHDAGALFVVDAVHHVPHGPTDVQAIGCDALVFSGYKLFSRHGSFLYLRPAWMESLTPYRVPTAPAHGPERWEWGTRDQALFAAIEGAIDYLAWLGRPSSRTAPKPGPSRRARVRAALEAIEGYEGRLTRLALEGTDGVPGLRDLPGVILYGPRVVPGRLGRDPTFSLKLAGWEDRDLATALWNRYALAVGAEDYYSRVPSVYGVETMVRATFVHYNTRQEALRLLRALHALAARRPRHAKGKIHPDSSGSDGRALPARTPPRDRLDRRISRRDPAA